MAASVLENILNQVVATVTGFGFQLNNTTVPVVLRKLPRREEAVDPGTQITVCKAEEPERARWATFPSTPYPKGLVKIWYYIEVTVISPNNDDQVTNLTLYTEWRETIRTAFQKKDPFLSSVPQVLDCNAKPGTFLDREEINENYDYQTVLVEVITLEPGA